MMRNINGFNINWGGQQRVLAERESAPKCGYWFNVSPNWMHVLPLHEYVGCSPEEAALFEKEAGKAVEEFLRQERGDNTAE